MRLWGWIDRSAGDSGTGRGRETWQARSHRARRSRSTGAACTPFNHARPGLFGADSEKRAFLADALLQAFANMAAQIENAGIGDAVKHAQPALAPRQQARRDERPELTGNIGLGSGCEADQFRDVLFPVLQGHQKLEPGRFTQRAEAGGDQLDGV